MTNKCLRCSERSKYKCRKYLTTMGHIPKSNTMKTRGGDFKDVSLFRRHWQKPPVVQEFNGPWTRTLQTAPFPLGWFWCQMGEGKAYSWGWPISAEQLQARVIIHLSGEKTTAAPYRQAPSRRALVQQPVGGCWQPPPATPLSCPQCLRWKSVQKMGWCGLLKPLLEILPGGGFYRKLYKIPRTAKLTKTRTWQNIAGKICH